MAAEFKATIEGQAAEEKACIYLQNRGLILLQKNFRSPCGEIDLIMRHGEEVVFVEVRLRRRQAHGCPLESVTLAKQRKLIKTAMFYLQKKHWLDQVPCRFDILSMQGHGQIDWIQNAFGLGFI